MYAYMCVRAHTYTYTYNINIIVDFVENYSEPSNNKAFALYKLSTSCREFCINPVFIRL